MQSSLEGENTKLYYTAKAWAEITISKWQEKIKRMKIGHSGQLAQSFAYHVVQEANGDFSKVELFFLYYGTFVDMGVGKGVDISEVSEQSLSRRLEGKKTGNRRRAKKWYSKVIYAETNALADILAEKHGIKLSLGIIEALPEKLPLPI